MLPHQRESYLVRCRDWYREAIHQIRKRIDISDPILSTLQDVGHEKLLQGTASVNSAGILAKFLPRISANIGISIQCIDREWRSLLTDNTVKKGGWEKRSH